MKFDGNVQRAFQLPPSPRLQVVQGASPTSHAQLSVRGGGAVLFGTSQESKEGVIIDNFSMRGTNGQSLGKLPVAMLSEFARVRPYDLIVLQYGVNAVNEQSDAPRLKKYIEADANRGQQLPQSFPPNQYSHRECARQRLEIVSRRYHASGRNARQLSGKPRRRVQGGLLQPPQCYGRTGHNEAHSRFLRHGFERLCAHQSQGRKIRERTNIQVDSGWTEELRSPNG